jgi:hypothetical protein
VCEKANARKTMTYQQRTQKPDKPMLGQTDNAITAGNKEKMNQGKEQLARTRIESFLRQKWLQTFVRIQLKE